VRASSPQPSRLLFWYIGPISGIPEIVGVLRLSHVDITVTDLDLACAYYTRVIGMIEVESENERPIRSMASDHGKLG
jgi:catechol-2,3-dioxygenase